MATTPPCQAPEPLVWQRYGKPRGQQHQTLRCDTPDGLTWLMYFHEVWGSWQLLCANQSRGTMIGLGSGLEAAKRAAEQHMLRFRLLRETPTDPADHDAKGHEPVDAYASLLPRGISMWTGETGFSGQSTITVPMA